MAKQTFTTGQVLTAAQMTSLQQTAMGGGSATAKTASYTLVAADAGTVVRMNSASATTITVNTSLFAAGDTVYIQNIGAGVCTITAGTATVNTASSLALAQYEGGTLYFTAASASLFFKAAPAAAGGGGKILQVVSGSYSTYTSTSSATFVDINAALNLSLTCATTSSRVLVLAHFNELYVSVDTRDIKIGVTAAGSIIQKADGVMLGSSGENLINQDLIIVHSPSSTSAVEYKMQFATRTSGAIEVNQNGSTGGCTLTLMEIGA